MRLTSGIKGPTRTLLFYRTNVCTGLAIAYKPGPSKPKGRLLPPPVVTEARTLLIIRRANSLSIRTLRLSAQGKCLSRILVPMGQQATTCSGMPLSCNGPVAGI